MSKDANSFGHDKALAWESRGFVYTKKRMHRFDTPSYFFDISGRYGLNRRWATANSWLPNDDFTVAQW